MSTNFNTCFIDSNGRDVAEEFVEKSYLLDVYPNLINQVKAPALWLWGLNVDGSLGTNSIIDSSSPVQSISSGTNWKQISVSRDHTAGIKTDGTLWLWGPSTSGKLGNNSTSNRSSPVQTVSGGTNWKQVSAGYRNTGAIKTDGTLWMWGHAGFGAIGDATGVARSSPVQTISAGTNWKQVCLSESDDYSAAIKTDGTLWLWGANANGQLGGNSSALTVGSPVQTVSAGNNWKQISINGFSAAIKTNGELWLWGRGTEGQLGTNDLISRSSPVQTVSGGTNWKQVNLGGRQAAAIKTDGTLWLWGEGTCGKLGTNDLISRSSPVQTVSGGTNWKQASLGCVHTAAIKTDGSLWMWGSNISGRLGDNTTTIRSSPVQTVSGGTNWKQVAAGSCITAAIREEGDW